MIQPPFALFLFMNGKTPVSRTQPVLSEMTGEYFLSLYGFMRQKSYSAQVGVLNLFSDGRQHSLHFLFTRGMR